VNPMDAEQEQLGRDLAQDGARMQALLEQARADETEAERKADPLGMTAEEREALTEMAAAMGMPATSSATEADRSRWTAASETNEAHRLRHQ
jgi:hypothetical protein